MDTLPTAAPFPVDEGGGATEDGCRERSAPPSRSLEDAGRAASIFAAKLDACRHTRASARNAQTAFGRFAFEQDIGLTLNRGHGYGVPAGLLASAGLEWPYRLPRGRSSQPATRVPGTEAVLGVLRKQFRNCVSEGLTTVGYGMTLGVGSRVWLGGGGAVNTGVDGILTTLVSSNL